MSTTGVKAGDVLAGKYRVERVLGAGGMGYVVAARHLQLDQLVAMKFLRKGAIDNAEATARFLREAKAVVKLRNEHVARVYDVGTLESNEPYIVMEHLDGCDLAALVKQRPLIEPAEACEYILQACEALAEAHSLGIIHRDIKLANLFVTRGPAGGPLVKVLDFGISKTNPFGESEHDMTRTASMLGSPRFMSPEQMRDPRAVDGRSDIWSLGVVLYRLVGGKPPFEADTLGRLLTMVMHEGHAPLASLRPDLPPGLSDVVSRCLEKDPAVRFANVAELAYALVPYASDASHARAAADRIAAVLSIPPGGTADPSIPVAIATERLSFPPNGSGNDTAAPWAGTHGGTRPRANQTLIALLAFVVLIACTVTFSYFRLVHARPVSQAAARVVPTGGPVPNAIEAPPPPILAAEPSRTPTVLGATPPSAPSPPAREGSPRRTAPVVRKTAPHAGSSKSDESGIPSSRE